MISKVAAEVSSSLTDFFNKRNVVLTAKYSPELSGISRYVRDYLLVDMKSPFAGNDISTYLNAVMYSIGTPSNDDVDKFKNFRIQVYSKLEDFNTSQGVIIENPPTPGNYFTLSKIRDKSDNSDEGKVIKRRCSYLKLPMRFMIMTESIENMYDCLLLLKQEVQFLNYLTVPLPLTEYSVDPDPVEYYLEWDVEGSEITYANFDDTALNTIEFGCNIYGWFFSNFFTEDHIIDTVDLTVGPIKRS